MQARTEQSEKRGPLSVTEQTLESLIRLTEASARIRLAEMAEIADAERAIEVMEASLEHIGAVVDSDDLDAEAVVSGDTEEFSDEELLLSVITELESSEHGANQEQVLAAGRKNGLSKTEAQQALKNLKQRGKAYEPKEGELRST